MQPLQNIKLALYAIIHFMENARLPNFSFHSNFHQSRLKNECARIWLEGTYVTSYDL